MFESIREHNPLRCGALIALCGVMACSSGRNVADASRQTTEQSTLGAVAAPEHGRVVSFEGSCDASGAIPLDARRFAVADDEDNVLRIYDAERGGPALEAFDLSDALSLASGAEADLEAATRSGEHAYFLSSHGRTRAGALDPNRLLFFSTSVPDSGWAASVVGTPYRDLATALAGTSSLARYDVQGAMERGELELEGLTAEPDGGLLVGFRRPVPEGRALIVRLENPAALMNGAPPQLGEPETLDLAGLGVRGLSSWHDGVLIIAGPAGNGGPFALYRWKRGKPPERIEDRLLDGFGPEGFFSHGDRNEVMVLSDDGTRLVEGVPCKRLADASRKGFRGVWLRLGSG
jgi:hypothetical protein